jgi:hypothetical protein
LAPCPKCRTRIPSPTRTWSVLDEPEKKGGMVERLVGIYECSKCGTKFPHVIGKQKFKIIKDEEWINLNNNLSKYEEKINRSQERINILEEINLKLQTGIKKLGQRYVISELKGKVGALETDVFWLREGKKELEAEITNSITL